MKPLELELLEGGKMQESLVFGLKLLALKCYGLSVCIRLNVLFSNDWLSSFASD